MIIAYLKSHVKFYLIPLIFLVYALPIKSEQSRDTFAATNLIDDQIGVSLATQDQPLNAEYKLKEKTQPRSLWSSATRLVKHGLKFRRQIFVRPSTPQHFNRSLTVFLTTFNAGGSNPPTNCLQDPGSPPSNDSLCHWLDFKGYHPDLVVIGLQEMSSLTIQNYFAATLKKTNKRQDVWLDAVETVINRSSRQYRRLKYVRLLGLFMVIYHRSDLPVTEIRKSTVNTGFLGHVGNKGSAGISLQIGDDDLNICFLNAHLAAGEEKEDLDNRNIDAARIARKMSFKGKTLDEHDAVFWMGDLNYRLSELSISREQVIQKCRDNDVKGLLKYDELLKQKLVGGTFADYQEAEINFGPTYKFEPGSTDWDESDKRRMPAWCDRIMFKSAENCKIELIENSYESVPSVVTSDHKPVKAMFVVKKINL